MTEEPGQLIAGRYLLGRCLARGGMGSVWEAEHVELESRVALKLLRPELGADAAHVERFRREARAAAKLKSPHVVTIYDCGVDRGTPYIAMEFLEGEDLELRLGRLGRLDPSEALTWLDQAARGLAVAHAAGLVHRDVKPANLFIERLPTGERLKVVDFGIARPILGDSTLTTGGGVWGSPAYMSPEQARGRAVDQRTDVWALAGVFYRMLTGSLPFRGLTEHDTIVEVCTGNSRPPSELAPNLTHALDELFVRAFAKEPAERTPSVEVLAQEAAEAIGQPISPFEVPASRPSAPPSSDSTRPPPAGSLLGRVTETKPISRDTGPTAVTTSKSSFGEAGPSRRLRVGVALGILLAAFAALVWSKAHAPQAASEAGSESAATAPHLAEPAPDVAPAREPSTEKEEQLGPPPVATSPEPSARAQTKAPTKASWRQPTLEPAKPAKEAPKPKPTDPLFGLPLEGDDGK